MDLKKLIPLIIAIVLCVIFVIYSGTVLEKGEHRPSTVINEDPNMEDIMEGFNFEN